MSVADLQRLFDDLEVVVENSGGIGGGGGGDLSLVIDAENGVMRVEQANTSYIEDSMTVIGEELQSKVVNVTTAGDTDLIPAPAAGTHNVIKKLVYQLLDDSVTTTVCIQRGTDNTSYHRFTLNTTKLHTAGLDFGSDGWPGNSAEKLVVNISGDTPATLGVDVNVSWVVRAD